MKSPLRKRLPRELKSEIGKYLVVLILMIATIGFVSGFLVADGSMLKAYNEGFEKYKIEDGNFRVKKKITKSQRENIEKNGVTLYENFYLEEALDNGNTMRIFKNREEVNLVCLMEGKLPEKAGEMAIDRMYADNNGISVGDILKSGSKEWKSQDLWHFLIIAVCFRTTMTVCLMQSNLEYRLLRRKSLNPWIRRSFSTAIPGCMTKHRKMKNRKKRCRKI